MAFYEIIETTGKVIDAVGVAVIVGGAVIALAASVGRLRGPEGGAYDAFRRQLGRSILLGLEFLVAADIINTVAVEPTVQSLIVLAGIVLIRLEKPAPDLVDPMPIADLGIAGAPVTAPIDLRHLSADGVSSADGHSSADGQNQESTHPGTLTA